MKLGDCNASRLPKADAALVMDVMNALFEFIEASVNPRRASERNHQSGTRLVRFFGDKAASSELLSLVKSRDMRELLSQLLKHIKSPELFTGLILNAFSKLFPGEQTCADISLVADSTASHICVPLWLYSTLVLLWLRHDFSAVDACHLSRWYVDVCGWLSSIRWCVACGQCGVLSLGCNRFLLCFRSCCVGLHTTILHCKTAEPEYGSSMQACLKAWKERIKEKQPLS